MSITGLSLREMGSRESGENIHLLHESVMESCERLLWEWVISEKLEVEPLVASLLLSEALCS